MNDYELKKSYLKLIGKFKLENAYWSMYYLYASGFFSFQQFDRLRWFYDF